MRNHLRSAVAVVLYLGCGVMADGGLITNGSFEEPDVPDGSFADYVAGATDITGWTLVGADVAVIDTDYVEVGIHWESQNGRQWIDLAGAGSNVHDTAVSQNVATTVGATYELSFY